MMLEQPCRYHTPHPGKSANHTTRNCSWTPRMMQGDFNLPPHPPLTETNLVKSQHKRAMEVNAVMPAVPKYMNWSEKAITWSMADHPKVMPTPVGYALVLDPIFVGPEMHVRFSKVLIDNGSSINILYKDTMEKLGISPNMLQTSRTTFHGIVPGVSCAPMGKIWIDVLFGDKDNCRVESLLFEVVDLESPYHALLGRPAFAKFMASTHTAYLKMKMSVRE